MADQLAGMIAAIKTEGLEPVLAKGLPGNGSFMGLEAQAETISGRLNQGDGRT